MTGIPVHAPPCVRGARLAAYEKLAVPGTDGLILVLFHAAPGSEAAQSLALLAQIAAEAANSGVANSEAASREEATAEYGAGA